MIVPAGCFPVAGGNTNHGGKALNGATGKFLPRKNFPAIIRLNGNSMIFYILMAPTYQLKGVIWEQIFLFFFSLPLHKRIGNE
jgi:hypothetical protein